MCNMMARRGNGKGQSWHITRQRGASTTVVFKTLEKCTAMFLIIEITTAASVRSCRLISLSHLSARGQFRTKLTSKKKKGTTFSFVVAFYRPSRVNCLQYLTCLLSTSSGGHAVSLIKSIRQSTTLSHIPSSPCVRSTRAFFFVVAPSHQLLPARCLVGRKACFFAGRATHAPM